MEKQLSVIKRQTCKTKWLIDLLYVWLQSLNTVENVGMYLYVYCNVIIVRKHVE